MFVCVCLWSLQELLLCPVWRIQEYVTLLQALSLHTQPGHPDHTHLSSALNTLLQFREFIQKVQHSQRLESVPNANFKCRICSIPVFSAVNTDVFLFQLKRNSERDTLMEETQQMIQGCPVKTLLSLPVFFLHTHTHTKLTSILIRTWCVSCACV